MQADKVQHFVSLIEARISELTLLDANAKDSRGIVTLDQQSVGRLSRMDALQQQAMARAAQSRRLAPVFFDCM